VHTLQLSSVSQAVPGATVVPLVSLHINRYVPLVNVKNRFSVVNSIGQPARKRAVPLVSLPAGQVGQSCLLALLLQLFAHPPKKRYTVVKAFFIENRGDAC
jgi:hypothetical protein